MWIENKNLVRICMWNGYNYTNYDNNDKDDDGGNAIICLKFNILYCDADFVLLLLYI